MSQIGSVPSVINKAKIMHVFISHWKVMSDTAAHSDDANCSETMVQ